VNDLVAFNVAFENKAEKGRRERRGREEGRRER
jgi:hypothetical protein